MLKKHQGETARSQQGLSVVVSDQTRENSNSDKGTFTEIIMPNGTDQILGLRLSQDNLNSRNSMRFAWEEKDNGWALALQFRGNPLQMTIYLLTRYFWQPEGTPDGLLRPQTTSHGQDIFVV